MLGALRAIPVLPVSEMETSVAFYQDQLGFSLAHLEESFALLEDEEVELHLWLAGDESWREREAGPPVVSGSESFIAGTASCRIEVEDIDGLYAQLSPRGVVHPNGDLEDKWYGLREFAVVDPDGNLIIFFADASAAL